MSVRGTLDEAEVPEFVTGGSGTLTVRKNWREHKRCPSIIKGPGRQGKYQKMNRNRKPSEIMTVLKRVRYALVGAAVFSFFINILMLVPPIYMLQIYDRVLSSRNVTTLTVITTGALGLLAVYALLEMLRSRVLVRIGVWLDLDLSPRVFDAVFRAAVQRPGGNSGQALRDLDTVRDFLTGQGLFAFFDAPWMPIYLIAIYLVHPALGMVSLIGGVLIFSLAVATEIATRRTLGEATVLSIAANRHVDHNLRNVEALEAMGMVPAMMRRWQVKKGAVLHLQALASDRAGLLSAASKFVRLSLQTAILGVGAYYVIQNQITAGLMIAGSILMGRALAPIEMAVATWKQLLAARSAYDRLNALLEAVPREVERMALPAPTGLLEVANIVAAPPGTQTPVLRNVSFRVAAGDILGIIGPSAAGKSSLARVMVGVWPAAGGVIRLDGADINTWERARLGPYVGYLPQDVELFEGSVAENIARFGEVDADEVIAAARWAGVHDLILQLSAGYNTQIGPNGQSLSGGQRQRIGLARALYRAPSLVVLDEPNSNLDRDGEAALAQAIAQLKVRRRTTIVITHRPNILASVDYIMVMQGGLIEQFGPRDDVLAQYMRPTAVAMPAGRAADRSPQGVAQQGVK